MVAQMVDQSECETAALKDEKLVVESVELLVYLTVD